MKGVRPFVFLFVCGLSACALFEPKPDQPTTTVTKTVTTAGEPSSVDDQKKTATAADQKDKEEEKKAEQVSKPEATATAEPAPKKEGEASMSRAPVMPGKPQPAALENNPAKMDAKTGENHEAELQSKAEPTTPPMPCQADQGGTERPQQQLSPAQMALANEHAAETLRKQVDARWESIKDTAKRPDAGKAIMYRNDNGAFFVKISDWQGSCHPLLDNGVPLQTFMDLAGTYLDQDLKCQREKR